MSASQDKLSCRKDSLLGLFLKWCRSENDCRYYRETNGWGTRKFGFGEPHYDRVSGLDASDASCIACQSRHKEYKCVRKLLPCHMQVLRTRQQRMRAVRYLLGRLNPDESDESSESDYEPSIKPRKKIIKDLGDTEICEARDKCDPCMQKRKRKKKIITDVGTARICETPPTRTFETCGCQPPPRPVCEPKKEVCPPKKKCKQRKEVCLCEKPKCDCTQSETDCRPPPPPCEVKPKCRSKRVCGIFCGKVRSLKCPKCASSRRAKCTCDQFRGDPQEKPCRYLHAPPCDQPRAIQRPRSDVCPEPAQRSCYAEEPPKPRCRSFRERLCRRCRKPKCDAPCQMPTPEPPVTKVCRKPKQGPRCVDCCKQQPKPQKSAVSQPCGCAKKPKVMEYTCVRDPEYRCRRAVSVRNAPCCAETRGSYKREWDTSTTPPCSKEWDTQVCCKQPNASCCKSPPPPPCKQQPITCCRQAAGGAGSSVSLSSSESAVGFVERCRKAIWSLMPTSFGW